MRVKIILVGETNRYDLFHLFHFFMGNKEGGSFHLLSCINLLMCSSPILCSSCLLFLMVARYDERSDVWSLGCIVLELATCGFLDVSNWMLKMWSMASKLMKVYQGIFMLVIHTQVRGYFFVLKEDLPFKTYIKFVA